MAKAHSPASKGPQLLVLLLRVIRWWYLKRRWQQVNRSIPEGAWPRHRGSLPSPNKGAGTIRRLQNETVLCFGNPLGQPVCSPRLHAHFGKLTPNLGKGKGGVSFSNVSLQRWHLWEAAFGSKSTTNVSVEWLQSWGIYNRVPDAVRAVTRDSDSRLGWIRVIRQSQRALSREARSLGPTLAVNLCDLGQVPSPQVII